ncbi:hypothetical protein ABGN05_14715 [Aquibium sp. LZ166]|uniref:SpoVG family protein n=1 Tax=Aquibium pacificus TaxID=3153579 RepID=A0ABV3SLP0_9HYPH
MKIIEVRPEPQGGPGVTIARFDVQVTPDVRFINMKLVRTREGGLRAYAPMAFGRSTATFSADLAERMANAAYEIFKRENPDNADCKE